MMYPTLENYAGGALVSSLLASMYLLWGLAWLAVAYAYGRAARVSWRAEGGQWRRLPGDVLAGARAGLGVIWVTLCNVFARRAPHPFPVEATGRLPITYTPGHRMRWAVFLSSITPATRGFYSSLTVSWSDWNAVDVLVNGGGTLLSIVAARNFLFLAYRGRPRVWGWALLAALCWFLLGPVVLYELGYTAQPRPVGV